MEGLFQRPKDGRYPPQKGFVGFEKWFNGLDDTRPTGIFICYRRDDTMDLAGHLHERLGEKFGLKIVHLLTPERYTESAAAQGSE